jgi:hypothetical protein
MCARDGRQQADAVPGGWATRRLGHKAAGPQGGWATRRLGHQAAAELGSCWPGCCCRLLLARLVRLRGLLDVEGIRAQL